MDFYTISMEYRGGTYVSQVWADDEKGALVEWAIKLDVKTIEGIGQQIKQRIVEELRQELEDDKPLLLNGLVNVWFTSLLIRDNLLSIDIIKTVV